MAAEAQGWTKVEDIAPGWKPVVPGMERLGALPGATTPKIAARLDTTTPDPRGLIRRTIERDLDAAASIAGGGSRAVHAKSLDEAAGALHDVASGAATLAEPLIGAGGVAAPIRTLGALIGASLGAKAGQAGSTALGASENVSNLAGDVGGVLGGGAGAVAAGLRPSLPAMSPAAAAILRRGGAAALDRVPLIRAVGPLLEELQNYRAVQAADRAAALKAVQNRAATVGRVPLYEGPDAGATISEIPDPQANPATMAHVMDPEALKALALQRLSENRAARSPAAQTIAQLKALGTPQPGELPPAEPPATLPSVTPAIENAPLSLERSPELQRLTAEAKARNDARDAATQAQAARMEAARVAASITPEQAIAERAANPPAVQNWYEPTIRPQRGDIDIQPIAAETVPTMRDLADPAKVAELAKHPKYIANQEAQAARVATKMTQFAKALGYTPEDLAQLQRENPDVFNAIAAKIDKQFTGSAKQETPWRASTPEPSADTLDLVKKNLKGK